MTLSNGRQVALSDMRKFAKVTLIDEAQTETGLLDSLHLANIGPEPLDKNFTFDIFKSRVETKPNGKIKTILMDQSVIAGVGNIYSDEALWRTGLHPEERVKNIPEAILKTLYGDVKRVLEKGIDFGGDSMSDYRNINGERGKFQEQHNAYRKTGKPCAKPGCTGTIMRKVVGGRSAHFCGIHQKLLKDRKPK
jgi:formamidopyrimidine-DNA glycosylase